MRYQSVADVVTYGGEAHATTDEQDPVTPTSTIARNFIANWDTESEYFT